MTEEYFKVAAAHNEKAVMHSYANQDGHVTFKILILKNLGPKNDLFSLYKFFSDAQMVVFLSGKNFLSYNCQLFFKKVSSKFPV